MRFFLAALSFLFILVIAGALGGLLYGWQEYTKANPLSENTIFLVSKGQGVAQIARNLEREGVIGQPLVFRAAARLSKRDDDIHAGEYEILAGDSMEDILDKMTAGDVYHRSITIPEGLTSWQIVQLLRARTGGSFEVQEIDIPPEGSLLPETYHYVRGDDVSVIIGRMQAAMTRTIDELWETRDENIPVMSKAEALILASIVEKETGMAGERDMVAEVFLNRLEIGMPLQTDPTVIYAMTGGKIEAEGQGPIGRRLLRKDLQIDSPYNTYKNPGLPPGPIANPGRAAIEAVLNPAEHDYLYFVADGSGGHAFAKTLAGHNANVAKWRKIRAARD